MKNELSYLIVSWAQLGLLEAFLEVELCIGCFWGFIESFRGFFRLF